MSKSKINTYIIITIVSVILFILWYINDNNRNEFTEVNAVLIEDTTIEKDLVTIPVNIKVYIAGEIINPGVYEIQEGSRLEDIILLAGGLTQDADTISTNLAKKVYDEEKIIIPKFGEVIDKSINNPQNDNVAGKININTATKEELKTLDGIGESISNDIISYRETNGDFKTIEEIKNVYRIGDKTFERIKDNIIVD